MDIPESLFQRETGSKYFEFGWYFYDEILPGVLESEKTFQVVATVAKSEYIWMVHWYYITPSTLDSFSFLPTRKEAIAHVHAEWSSHVRAKYILGNDGEHLR